MATTPIQREPPSRRKHYRVTAPISVEINGVERPLSDWSAGGFRLLGIDGTYSVGDEFSVTVSVPYQGFVVSSRQKAKVIRYSPEEGEMACEFIDLDERTAELLSYFVQGLVGGEMTSIDGIIKRIDVPVTLAEHEIQETWRGLPFQARARRLLVSFTYIAAGVAVALYLLMTVYSSLFRVQIETGVVTVPRAEIVAPFSGVIQRILVPVGQTCQKDEVLLELRDQALLDDVDEARLKVKEAETFLAESSSKLAAHDERVEIYRQVGERQLVHFERKVEGLTGEVSFARKELERQEKLASQNVVSQGTYEVAASNLTRLQKELDMASQELSLAAYNLQALEKGFFFSGNDLEGNAPELRADVETAKQQVELFRERLEQAMAKTSRLLIKSPFAGRVLDYGAAAGTMIPRGAPLIYMEEGVSPVIEAYLTQDEVARIMLGGEAIAFLPPLDRRCDVKILSIDRTDGYADAHEQDYQWRDVDERTALVTLQFEEADTEGVQAGMPAMINIQRHHDHSFVRAIQTMFITPLERIARSVFSS